MGKRVTLTPKEASEVVALLEWAAMHNPVLLGKRRTLELAVEIGNRQLVSLGIAKASEFR